MPNIKRRANRDEKVRQGKQRDAFFAAARRAGVTMGRPGRVEVGIDETVDELGNVESTTETSNVSTAADARTSAPADTAAGADVEATPAADRA
ncbi:MAG: hypothetical protein HY329_11950 [Chloroflexi bacterium]|nr:hypothetical protein [Chloroflexota bacterium]